MFRACLVNGVLDENRVRQAVPAVVAQKPRGYLASFPNFSGWCKLEMARRTARVESAAALTPQFQAQVQADLTRRYGGGLEFYLYPESRPDRRHAHPSRRRCL